LGEANVLKAIGDVQQFRDEREAALASYAEALGLFRAVGARLGEANVLKAIGDVQQFRDEREAALASYAEALGLFRAVGARVGEANVLAAQTRLALAAGDLAAAETQLEQVILMRRAIGDLYSEGADYGNFAIALLNLGQKEKAREYALKARKVFEKVGEAGILQQVDGLIAACEAE
jgi:tetratricopeptide (TPR) repeat protein